jgi:branched-chain amino acid transport system substrate-binding protein
VACLAALACVGAGSAARASTTQELSIPVSDGAQLACALVEPDGTPPSGGWPAIMLFHGLGGRHQDLEQDATGTFAPVGYASLMCDARGHGASGGLFGLDGPRDVQDTRELFQWLTARPEISDTQIGAYGVSLGGGAVWQAAAAGVPFKAIVPVITWTNLLTALAPQGLSKSGLVQYLAALVPQARWDPSLLAAVPALTTSSNLAAVSALASSRSPARTLPSLTVPTLLIQGRHDFLFDIDQALTAFRSLHGPKALYLGDLGHAPASNPAGEQPVYLRAALQWLDRFVRGVRENTPVMPPVTLAHDPWDGTVTRLTALPATRTISVMLPGTTAVKSGGKVVRSVRLPGGPFETFGVTTITVPYANASGWDRLVAVLSVSGSSTPVTAGGVKLSAASGTATIRLMNEAVRFPRGSRLTITLGATSVVQSPSNALYLDDVQPGSSITIGRSTLKLSVLARPVSTARRLAAAAATHRPAASPGVTNTQILLGGTGPLTGAESAYEPVLSGANAYFKYVNAHGGVYGRKIVYRYLDDAYDPARTVSLTQQLVEQDGVFAIFNTIGTEHALAIRDYLNKRKVPELLAGTGAAAIATQHATYPWTIGLLPGFVGEGAIYGKRIAAAAPGSKVAVLYEDSVYGKELLAGLRKGLGPAASSIVGTQSYVPTEPTVASQVLSLKSTGADTFVIFALPTQAISAMVGASRVGWTPKEYVSSVSIDPAVMKIVKLNAGATAGDGAISTAFLHDPTNPTQQKAPGVVLYEQIMKRYLPNEDPKAVAHLYGMMAAYAMVDALRHAGRNPTRAGLLAAATHLRETNPFLLPGITIATSPQDYYPIGSTYLVRYGNGYWNVLGKPLPTG